VARPPAETWAQVVGKTASSEHICGSLSTGGLRRTGCPQARYTWLTGVPLTVIVVA
jgi:hypothetical protein